MARTLQQQEPQQATRVAARAAGLLLLPTAVTVVARAGASSQRPPRRSRGSPKRAQPGGQRQRVQTGTGCRGRPAPPAPRARPLWRRLAKPLVERLAAARKRRRHHSRRRRRRMQRCLLHTSMSSRT